MIKKSKLATLICLGVLGISIQAQNVGINATGAAPNTSAGLDVNFTNKGVLIPNINLTSNTDAATIPSPAPGLLVYNTNAGLPCGVGYYYNAGTTAAPVWVCFKKQQQIVQMYGTATRAAVTSAVFAVQPGLSTTIVVPAGQTAVVSVIGDIGIRNISTLSGYYSIVDVAIYWNGSPLAVGGWNRYETANSGYYNQNAFGVVPVSATFTVGAGTHTIAIYSRRFGGTTSADIGGNCTTDTNCGEFTVFINYQ